VQARYPQDYWINFELDEQWQPLWADVAAQAAADPLGQGRAHAARRDWAQAADYYAWQLERAPLDNGEFWFEYAALLAA
jgi:hypothetical protein